MSRVWFVLLLALTALSGCIGDGPDTGPDGTEGEGIGTGAIDARVTVQANTSATEPVTIIESGAVAPYQSVCVDGCDYDRYSLIAEMEDDTAYFVEATLSWTPTADQFNPVGMSLIGEAGIRDFAGIEYSDDSATFTATLLAAGQSDVFIEVWSNGIPGEGPTASYDLEVIMTPVPDSIPQYAPAAVKVPEGGALLVESLSGAGRVMVFDGNDALVGVFDVDGPTTLVNETDRLQEFVVFTLNDIWAKAYVEQDPDAVAPELRHVPLEVSWADLGTVSEAGPKSFTFDVDRPALNVAFRFGSFKPCGTSTDGCFISIGTTARLQGPDGSELTGTDNYNCYLCGGGAYYRTSYDDGPMPAGTYTVEYNSENSYDVRLHSSTIHYIR